MFRIKICGLTTLGDARWAVQAGADALGLNFFPQSKRFLPLEHAEAIVPELPKDVWKVGVFVNASRDEIMTLATRLGLDAVQLHGEESPEFAADLGDLRVIKAFRPQGDPARVILPFLEQAAQRNKLPTAVLLDAHVPNEYGGTGRVADWDAARRLIPRLPVPLVLAGGLTPENVAAAIRQVGPAAVDTASGVEVKPGRKHPERMLAFCQLARDAFDA